MPDRRVRQRQELLEDVARRACVRAARAIRGARSASRSDTKTGSIDASANAGLMTTCRRGGGGRRRARRPRRTTRWRSTAVSSGSPSSRSQSAAGTRAAPATRGRSCRTRWRRARVRRATPAPARHAERRVGAQLERIAEVVVEAAEDGVDARRPATRLQVDAIVAHRRGRRPRRAGSRASAAR